MDPLTMSLLISGGVSAVKGITGAAQYLKGKKLAKNNVRPTYDIPSSVNEYLANARNNSNKGLPGQNLIEQKLGASTASGVRQAQQGASSSAALMATIAGLKGSEQQGLTDIGIKSAEYQDINQQRLQEALLKYGNYQDKEFDINKQQPFEDNALAAQALKGSGLQNIMSGIEGIGGAASFGAKSKLGTEDTGSSVPFGKSNAMGQSGSLGRKSNPQKYLNDLRTGKFKGGYQDWITSKSLNSKLDFNNQLM